MHNTALPAVLAPVITPFQSNHEPCIERLARHCQWLLNEGVGLAVFGTNSEGNSLSVRQKRKCLDGLLEKGLPPNQFMPGTGACSLDDAVELTRSCLNAKVNSVLMLPPFYYKNVPDDGLYFYFSDVIQALGDTQLQVYLYNIPQVSHVKLSVDLLERLVKTYPDTVVGMKDSSGDWAYTESCIKRLGPMGFRVYAGSETFLLQTLRAGGVGCISATANVNPSAIATLAAQWQSDQADAMQAKLDAVRKVFQSRPMIAAMKAAVAHSIQDPRWRELLSPLQALDKTATQDMLAELSALGFIITSYPSKEQ
ncbi:MAG: dihydrodipicolinate synthase family protein [Bordetella sp.]